MDKCRINVAVIEPSLIVYEGLSNVLHMLGNHYFIYRLNDLEELMKSLESKSYKLAIINPCTIQNKVPEFVKLRKKMPGTGWIGLVYSLFDDKLLMNFDELIMVTEQSETIQKKLEQLYDCCNCNNGQQEILTERETNVLALLVKGLSNKEIAAKLKISIHTVNTHRKNIIEKTGIKSLSGLTIYAISKKVIPLNTKSK